MNTLHAPGDGPTKGRAYCGRRTRDYAPTWTAVSCRDCLAARDADLKPR